MNKKGDNIYPPKLVIYISQYIQSTNIYNSMPEQKQGKQINKSDSQIQAWYETLVITSYHPLYFDDQRFRLTLLIKLGLKDQIRPWKQLMCFLPNFHPFNQLHGSSTVHLMVTRLKLQKRPDPIRSISTSVTLLGQIGARPICRLTKHNLQLHVTEKKQPSLPIQKQTKKKKIKNILLQPLNRKKNKHHSPLFGFH